VASSHPRSLPPVAPGTVLAQKYRVERVLGQGGMGVVVEARHIALEERVALKFLLPDYANHPEASGRFLREARAAVKIKSEHVARVSDVGTLETGAPYMVMEYLDGSDLSKVLATRGLFPLEDAIDFIVQACDAIAEAHSYGIVHRDLKPANLFLTRRADGSPLVKVLDFGISKVASDGVESLTRTTAAMGSALYMSPEQMQQTRSVDQRTDIYALGVSLFELLGGRQPFYADSLPQLCAEILTGSPTPLRQFRPDIPEAFATALERAYARDRNGRYQSVGEFVNALAPFAPQRSQALIDRIARLCGLKSMSGSNPSGSIAILPGPYTGPSSANSRAAFAAGGTSAGLSRTAGRNNSSPSAGIVVAVVAIVVALVGATGAILLLRHRGATTPTTATGSVTPSAEPTAPMAPPQTTVSALPPDPTPPAVSASASVEPKGPRPPPNKRVPGAPATAATPAPPPPSPPPPSHPPDSKDPLTNIGR
jgi:serine/threonine-protein kinase